MTTPHPHLTLPPAPAPPAPSPSGRGPGNRRTMVTGAVAALVLLLVAGGAAGWWLTRDEDTTPYAGRPRVTDDAAGLSYAIPEGWEHDGQQKLISAFTSSVTKKQAGGEGGSTVLAGRGGAVPQPALQRQTERAARSNAEFFYPDGSSELEESRPTTVDGRPAHTVALRVSDGKQGTGTPGHLRLTLVAVDDSRSAFLLGVAQPGGPEESREADKVMESTALEK
ncbi:hypothetical protein IPZ58_33830 [Streptomyces roseoverticillatus]|uniref:hypothetical protein n=1 Tax=Streptomyces roseoverticillatus TaxID=66429 RepID=UPI001F3C9861|nr:hypothetical protein [Streptomyces roseoverticillatus]MCF3106510.1 hypothetical protein [Streptomyces roseoverticillatus]